MAPTTTLAGERESTTEQPSSTVVRPQTSKKKRKGSSKDKKKASTLSVGVFSTLQRCQRKPQGFAGVHFLPLVRCLPASFSNTILLNQQAELACLAVEPIYDIASYAATSYQ